MILKLVAAGMLMTGVLLTGLLTTGTAEAQKNDAKINMQNFTADEQQAAIQGGRVKTTPIILAEAPQLAPSVATPTTSNSSDPSSWNIPVAIWLAASGLAGMGLLQRRKK
jgi:hypothetical protein